MTPEQSPQLPPGTMLGPYRIDALVGAGGMGHVYRAHDTRLGRDVAIKILPPQFAADPESRARFDREARTISQLNHPHICVLHDVGHHDGVDFLVMEHLDGETLEARLVRGPLACDDALRIAIQIASALDKAHRAGIVHRDLKPGNIMLTKSGGGQPGSPQAKLLDFGLAKAGAAAVTGASATMLAATPANLTARGTILGTFQYMAPEQLEGQPADARSDIFAFGSVLYEMITGKKAFEGKSQASLIGAILKDQPAPLSTLQPVAPAALDHVTSRCLAKDPDARWQSAADLVAELQWIAAAQSQTVAQRGRAGVGRRERLLWIAAVVATVVIGGSISIVMWRSSRPSAAPSFPTARAIVPIPTEQTVAIRDDRAKLAISPDGRLLAYVAANANATPSLFIRKMNEQDAHPILGTDGAVNPFFSPDSRSVGFLSGRLLKTVTLGGGAPTTVFDDIVDLRGADWGDDGWIYFTPRPEVGIWRVRAEGGTHEVLTTPDFAQREKSHRWPFVLPGSKAVLFVVSTSRNTSFDDARIEVLSLDTRTRHPLIAGGTYPRYVPSGHIVYSRAGAIVAVPFDLHTLELRGEAVAVESSVQGHPAYGFADFASSRNGTLVYVQAAGDPAGSTLLFGDRTGSITPTGAPSALYSGVSASPVDTRLAGSFGGATQQIVILDLTRPGATTRLTHEWDNMEPTWTPDGKRIAFCSNRGSGTLNLYWQAADGGGEAEPLTTSAHVQAPGSWAADSKTLAFVDNDPTSHADIWVVNVDDRKPRPFIKTPFEEGNPAFSPDGHWLAYMSNDSGGWEVYVQAFPAGGRRYSISIGGGGAPLWNRKTWTPQGGELFYQKAGGDVMAVAIATSPEFRPGTPTRLFHADAAIVDVMRDGGFLMIREDSRPPVTHFNVVFNWFEELASRVPARVR